MYSKERGFSHPPARRGAVYPSSRTPRVSVPPNYSGHAIVDGEERPLGTLHEDTSAAEDRADAPTPRFDGLPRVSELGGESRRVPRTLPVAFSVAESPVLPPDGRLDEAPADPADAKASAVAVPPVSEGAERPSALTPLRFLSGQGIGLEELLILGLILFLLRENGDCEDRGDLDETVILLGLLLLLG